MEQKTDRRKTRWAFVTVEEKAAFSSKVKEGMAKVPGLSEKLSKHVKTQKAKKTPQEWEEFTKRRLAAVDREKYKASIKIFRENMSTEQKQQYEAQLSMARDKLTPEMRSEAGKKGGAAHLGIEIRAGALTAKGHDNIHATYWRFRSPKGVIMEGKSLLQLIRDNIHLFEPEQVVWTRTGRRKSIGCRASKGLQALTAKRGKAVSWHGWTAMVVDDSTEHPSFEDEK